MVSCLFSRKLFKQLDYYIYWLINMRYDKIVCCAVVFVIFSGVFLPVVNSRYIDYRGLNSLIGNDEIISLCNEYYYNESVREALVVEKENLLLELENYNVSKYFLEGLFAVDKTFDVDRIRQRIDSLKIGSVLEDVMSLLEVPKTYDDFNDSRNFYGQLVMQYWSYTNYSDIDGLYSIIDKICSIIARISMIWVVPITILFGLKGLIMSSIITYVFFAPVTVPMSLFICFDLLLKDTESDLRGQILEIAVLEGLVGLILHGLPLLFKAIFMEDYGIYGISYVMEKISFLSLVPLLSPNYDVVFGESSPDVRYAVCNEPKVNEFSEILVRVIDEDVVEWNGKKEVRDYIIIGFDYNNDMVFEDWSFPMKDNDGFYYHSHKFTRTGKQVVNIVAYDICGVCSDVYSFQVFVVNSRNRIFDFPIISRLFTCLKNVVVLYE